MDFPIIIIDEWIFPNYHLDVSTLIIRGIRSDFKFSYKFLVKILLANRIAPVGTPRSAQKDARLKYELTSQYVGTVPPLNY